jgi:hypothetical protein
MKKIAVFIFSLFVVSSALFGQENVSNLGEKINDKIFRRVRNEGNIIYWEPINKNLLKFDGIMNKNWDSVVLATGSDGLVRVIQYLMGGDVFSNILFVSSLPSYFEDNFGYSVLKEGVLGGVNVYLAMLPDGSRSAIFNNGGGGVMIIHQIGIHPSFRENSAR